MAMELQDFTEKLIETRETWTGGFLRLNRDSVELPDGRRANREYVRHPGAAMVIPYRNGEVMLVNQYRHAVRSHVLEFPAGKLDLNELPEDAARRELQEETGLEAGKLEKIYTLWPSVATSDEVLYLYQASDLIEGGQALDEGEFLERLWLPLEAARKMIGDGSIRDSKTILGILHITLQGICA